ncbi:MAG: carbamoyltransferase HypF [Solirubrobacterales bacterium]|nr:carbamoyltransferase HypF [Solirubrobacterales bacterium]
MALAPPPILARRRLDVEGTVQGVGFRPFVHGLAVRHGVHGHVLNTGRGVTIEAEGEPAAIARFAAELETDAPVLARVGKVTATELAPRGDVRFEIRASRPGAGAPAIPADAPTCEDCLRELFDPADRRHGHPFISCTNCGPRLTMVVRAPYDRANTTMARFPLCAACRAEYEDPADRRFHAESTCCPDCGPRLSLPLTEAVELLLDGAVVAVKGLGGFHLACLAADEDAVARLRSRKRRDAKPFAVMTNDPGALVVLDAMQTGLLTGPERPILLARRRAGAPVARAVAPGDALLGVLLPYTPLHHLLLRAVGAPLVMTSANRSDEPIVVDDDQARRRLAGIADAILGHDRAIHRRCEDSVVRREHVVRRSRGYAPRPMRLPVAAARPLLAVGAELKSTFCVATGHDAFVSPHLGDLRSFEARSAFHADRALYTAMLRVRPEVIAHDLHPDYAATAWAREQDAELVPVQHHHAHAAACLAEHGRDDQALALVFDGTGLGTDGTLWGGELLRCDLFGFERVAHLEAVPLPGGEAAVRQPWRTAAAYLEQAGRPVPFPRWPAVRQSLGVNAPRSSGMGRLFDAVAALLGVREEISYEGQAAIELERLAGDVAAAPYPCRIVGGVVRGADLVAAAHDDLEAGRPRAQVAAAFHEGVAAVSVAAVAAVHRGEPVVLSGGTFQNVRLLSAVERGLASLGCVTLAHRTIPPNDGGISFGQAAIAARRIAACA